nr:MAG TPA: hypothetical protein [Caudoviricetes sp.]
MLTKQEREATIERIKSYGDSDLPFYKLLFGSRAPYAMQYTEYLKALKDRVIDLCDTSNMIELPLDKNGEIIHIGDVVYAGDKEWKVSCVKYSDDSSIISVYSDNGCTEYRPDELTHKKLGTIESLVERFEIVLAKGQLSAWAVAEISDIVNQLEKLGDSDD